MTEWFATNTEMPDSGLFVLAHFKNGYGKDRVVRAMWAAERSVPAGDNFDDFYGDYDEEQDECFCPEGWYEMNDQSEEFYSIDDPVLHWTWLPEPPGAARRSPR